MPVSVLGFLISGCHESLCGNRLGYLYSDSSWGEQLLVGRAGFQCADRFVCDFQEVTAVLPAF